MVLAMRTPQRSAVRLDADPECQPSADDAVGPRPAGDAPWWIRALSETERAAQRDEPAWVAFTRQALALAPEAPPRTAEPQDLNLVPGLGLEGRLIHPLWPFLVAAGARFDAAASTVDAVDRSVVWEGARRRLAGRLVRLAGRTLVAELHATRAATGLHGRDPYERFDDFMRCQALRARLTDLLHAHPVLARLIAEYCLQAVEAADELARRLRDDRGRLLVAEVLDEAPGALVSVEFGLGDPHADGRTVCILDFSDGQRLVYQPRPLGLHARWNAALEWLARQCPDLASPTVRVLPRGEYGWTGFVEPLDCERPAQIERFYERLGAQLALLYALDATDIHAENLIAHGEFPMIVDVETLFHPSWLPRTDGGTDPAAAAFAASALRTAVLPSFIFGEEGALDVSALGARSGDPFPDDLPVWQDPGTDTMRLVLRPVPFSPAANRPRLAAADPIDPIEYEEALIRGFRIAYQAITAHPAAWLDENGILDRFGDERIRLVLRPSQTYAVLLAESTDPSALTEWNARERTFATLFDATGHDHLRALAREELAQLLHGDVPTFTAPADSRSVRTLQGHVFPDLLQESGLARARAKIHAMGADDLRRQEWVIRASLATKRPHVGHTALRAAIPTPRTSSTLGRLAGQRQELLSVAAGIGDRLVADAVRECGRTNWLGLECFGGRYWSVRPLGAGLADGYGGVALFLAELGRVSGVARYLEVAAEAARPLPRLAGLLAGQPSLSAAVGPGGFSGIGGICYALARLANLLESPVLAAAVPAAVTALGHACDPARSYGVPDAPEPGLDIADGLAGAILAGRAVFAECGLADAGRLAETVSARVASRPGPNVPGFLWGRDGVAAALGVATAPAAADHLSDLGWCRGLAGLTSSEAARERYLALVANRVPLRDRSLCHGELGVLEPLVGMAAAGDGRASATLDSARTRLLESLAREGVACGTPAGVSTPGLLSGLAGIGYGLLRLASGDALPSVLFLQPTNPAHKAAGREITDGRRS